MKERVFIYDGSFNPVTLGHKKVAEELIKKHNANRVLMIPMPNFYKAYKPALIPVQERINMIRNLNIDKVGVLDISSMFLLENFSLKGVLDYLSSILDLELTPVIGSDVVADIENWYNGKELLEKYKILVIERKGYGINAIIEKSKFLQTYKENIIVSDIIPDAICSTDVRNRIDEYYEDQCEDLIAKSTFQYIKEHNLYI